jgi:hypothetical protein
VDEIAPAGSTVYSSYVARPITVKLPATAVKVILDANVPSGTFLDVYYRAILTNNYGDLSKERWYKISTVEAVADVKDFYTFKEYNFEKLDIPAFDRVQLKIVFRSNNEALTPRIKNLRMMALA